ncbi:GIY-YIG nuclease family protein [Sphingomonas sp. 7/4-4]|jgi:predicted GIY-YIG superfamily endonuclease|uniref:GIY-YIG nuclease family protein n=1 Tax=Sphingomonas sp. 7/4-4 TaxID=3018446 RepID=UPI0022F39AD2|nr:GIY-YIG nuclease family protein [Sphingomonas sp. 7/4-4]WBY06640.1 GIY-YIG nuclease family protein [Sphingomonas sp. 7/4-4]
MGFWVYLLRCRDGAYYAGHAEDVEARVTQHQSGVIKGFTSSRLPVKLVWCAEFPTRYEAIVTERRIKGWSRAKKEALIAGDWERLSILARNRQDDGRPSTSSGRTAVVNPGAS